MGQKFTDAARATLSASIISTDTTLSIGSGGSLFPVANTGTAAVGPSLDWFKAVLQDGAGIEIVYVRTHTSGATSFGDVLRGQDGTTARSFASGATLGLRPLASDATEWEAHVDSVSNPHGVTAAQVGARELLTQTRTYYVRTDGSDSNGGLSNTSGGAFRTVHKAVSKAQSLDTSLFGVTVHVADGDYSAEGTLNLVMTPGTAGAYVETLILIGNTTTPENVTLPFVQFPGVSGTITVNGFKLSSGVGQWAPCVANFTNCVNYADFEAGGKSLMYLSNVTMRGASQYNAIYADTGAQVFVNGGMTLLDSPNYAGSFVWCRTGALVNFNIQPTGSATGMRYLVESNGVVNCWGNGETYLPGNSAGVKNFGGQYIGV